MLEISERASILGAYFEHKTVMLPKEATRYRGGEDAADADDTFLTVADGVGGWAAQGVDPGLFSRALTSTALAEYERHPFDN